jgi:hypothetical protein
MDGLAPEGAIDGQSSGAKSAVSAISSLVFLGVVSVVSVQALDQPNAAPSSIERPELEDLPEAVQEPAKSPTLDPSLPCEEIVVRVGRTGQFAGAKLRAIPGFEHEQAAIVTRGAHLVVCEISETPGTKVPNRWYRIHEGEHKGLWIHKQVLDF